jgi:carbonic anhydrase/acetyltransferase-like protein (isoleucine patch superfamily)
MVGLIRHSPLISRRGVVGGRSIVRRRYIVSRRSIVGGGSIVRRRSVVGRQSIVGRRSVVGRQSIVGRRSDVEVTRKERLHWYGKARERSASIYAQHGIICSFGKLI